MSDTGSIVKVWIAEGCIVCDACVNECPQVFEIVDETCIVKPEAANPEFLIPLSEAVLAAAKGCPTEVIKYDFAGQATASAGVAAVPAASKPAAAVGVSEAKAPAKPAAQGDAPATDAAPAAKPAKAPAKSAPPAPVLYKRKTVRVDPGTLPDPLAQAQIEPAGMGEGEIARARAARRALDGDVPPDVAVTVLGAAGAYRPRPALADQVRRGITRRLWQAVRRAR
jgi:ferredoxin